MHTFIIPSTLKTENLAPNNDNAITTLCNFVCLINLTHKESECEYELSPELLRLVEQEAKQIQSHDPFFEGIERS